MKIVYVAAGAADMYCGTCLHDNTLAAALLAAGEDVVLVPAYTPLRTDEEDVSSPRLFFGGVNVYLQQTIPLFRHTPWLLDKLLDRPGLIRFLTRLAPSVDPQRLGPLTLSMLMGEEGHQRKELEKLIHWLRRDARPDVVHLSNAMLLGMAGEISRLGTPVICTLSGEDIFLERLPEPYYSQARQALRARAQQVEAFVALNHYYADYMADYLEVPRQRIHVIPHGLNLAGHAEAARGATREGFTIGYLARICHDKGLHHLVAAMELLLEDSSLPPVRLRVAGYLSPADRGYFEAITARARRWRFADRFEYAGAPSRQEKIAFLQSLDVMSVPTVYRESKGISALEALANAVPVVLPAHGAFPELVEDTGGGLLFRPGDPHDLAQTLKRLIERPDLAADLGRAGQKAVRERYSAEVMARQTRRLYERVVTDRQAGVRDLPTPSGI